MTWMRGSSFCSRAVHQASDSRFGIGRQRQNGDGRAAGAHLGDGLGRAAMAGQRRQRAEMLARKLGESASRVGVADGNGKAALHAGRRGEELAPDADDALRRQGAVMARQQPAQDGSLPPGPESDDARRFGRGDALDDFSAADQQIVDGVVELVEFGAQRCEVSVRRVPRRGPSVRRGRVIPQGLRGTVHRRQMTLIAGNGPHR